MRAQIQSERVSQRLLQSERGFTFIEIMVVVAILAILAALVTLGVAVYFAALRLLGVVTLKELAALQRKS